LPSADILNKNIELHLNLVGKIQAMEAMDLRGIEQGVVEKVILDFEEGMEKFRESVQSGDGVIKSRNEVLTTKDKDELRKLESEILGEAKPAEKKNADMDAEHAALEEELKGRESKQAEKETPKAEPQVE
jgi:tRNA threonylcarbamoyladenosine modification (KEOPS) complex Cgi121 subunit